MVTDIFSSNTISLSYSPDSGTITGITAPATSATSNVGTTSFSNLKILTAASSYTFTITSPGLTTATLTTGAITTAIKELVISEADSNVNLFTNFQINYVINGEDGAVYPVDTTVSISASPNDGSVIIDSSSVSWLTKKYFIVSKTTTGSVTYTLTDSVGSKTDTISLTFDAPKLKVVLSTNVIFI